MEEDSAVGKLIQEQERPSPADPPEGVSSAGRESIIGQGVGEGVGAARSSEEASNDRGAKRPQWKHAESDEQRNRLNVKRSATEQAKGSGPTGQPVEPHLPPKVAALRQKLAQKAKQEPKFRFYSLYGGVMDKDTLLAAWWKVCSNGGAPGVDGLSIEQIVLNRAPETTGQHGVRRFAKLLPFLDRPRGRATKSPWFARFIFPASHRHEFYIAQYQPATVLSYS